MTLFAICSCMKLGGPMDPPCQIHGLSGLSHAAATGEVSAEIQSIDLGHEPGRAPSSDPGLPALVHAEGWRPKPKRIQRRRSKGWKMPEGAVYVGRPTKWGNPFKIGDMLGGARLDRAGAMRWYLEEVTADSAMGRDAVKELRGKDLACWCPLDQPCHADVLLELANPPALAPPPQGDETT